MVGARDGDVLDAAKYLASMFQGMGDDVSIETHDGAPVVRQRGQRVVRGLEQNERELVFTCWQELWRGALAAQRELKTLRVDVDGDVTWWVPSPGLPA
ncbi:MAG: hypothetical protein KDI19_07590 [Pseudomonadales bacterium]|nr:hypothetical protein [Pseudomonadales bacterium]